MNKLALSVISLVLLLGLVAPTAAQVDLPRAGITPDSPFYFLDQWGKGLSMAFTFSSEAKANKALKFSEERLAEIKTMAKKGKTEQSEKLTEDYQRYLNLAQEKSEQTKESQKKERFTARVASSTSKHLSVLEEVREKVPEEAKQSIDQASENSKKGHMQALNALSKSNPEQAAKIGAKGLQERTERIKSATGTERARAALEDFEDLSKDFHEMAGRTDSVDVQQLVGSSTSKHLDVLKERLEEAPEEAQQGLQQAIESSQQGRERAMESLEKSSEGGNQKAEDALERMRERSGSSTPSRGEEADQRDEDGEGQEPPTEGEGSGQQPPVEEGGEDTEEEPPVEEQSGIPPTGGQ